MRVLRLLGSGKSNKEVAVLLGLSARTVEVHRANLYKKLKANSVADLVKCAIQLGLASLNPPSPLAHLEAPNHEAP